MHNNYLISLILGIVEGFTEFLPVSSTAHLKIAENILLGVDANSRFWDMYTVVIQLGAILALPVFFWNRILKFVRTFPRGERGARNIFTHPLSLVMIAFVVTAVPSFLLTKLIKHNLDNLTVIGAALLIGGAVMWAVDSLCTHSRTEHMENMTLPQAIWIGACQILSAVFPGTSRSMSTIAAGQVAGMSRASALEFSFFLSMPTMLVATVYSFIKEIHPKTVPGQAPLPSLHLSGGDCGVLAIGLVVSFVVALVVVAWFMSWVRRRGFVPFAIYRIVLGLLVLIFVKRLTVGE